MYADLDRPPLRAAEMTRAVVYDGSLWRSVEVVARTGSTNADLAATARSGAPEGAVLVAEEQTGGRGRLDRRWVSPSRAGLTFSMLFRPPVPAARRGWLPLLAGVAVAGAVRSLGAVPARLKWPNDLLLGDAKVAGVLAEVVEDAVVIGVGLNVSTRRDELPDGGTSLAVVGAECTDRDPLLRAILREVEVGYRRWCQHGGDAATCGLRAAYVELSDTLGREVSVALPSGARVAGRAEDIDSTGRLVLRVGSERNALAAGDVTHVRRSSRE